MAKLILEPIGSKIENLTENLDIKKLDQKLDERRQDVFLGWGKKYQERVREKGKLTAYERILGLADSPDKILFINTFVNFGLEFGEDKKTSPSAGVLTAFV